MVRPMQPVKRYIIISSDTNPYMINLTTANNMIRKHVVE